MIDGLRRQASYCQTSSPLYAALFETLVKVFEAHEAGRDDPGLAGFFETVDACWRGRRFSAWFERPLLLAGALHEQVLEGQAPGLARFYASCGGHFETADTEALARAVTATLTQRHQHMADFLRQPSLHTNETSRGLTWLLPLLAHWQQAARPPLTLIELGCSAGLGLVADRYGYQVKWPDGRTWTQGGTPSFTMELLGPGARQAAQSLPVMAAFSQAVTRRIGCDLNPLDCSDARQRRQLEALIWGDNAPRLARLRAAMKTQNASVLHFVPGDMVESVQRLASGSRVDTPMLCLFNTVATCYLDDAHYARLRSAIAAAFHGPWADRESLWIEFELPRRDEALPVHAQGKEQLIKLHRGDGQGGLRSRYFGAAAAHPQAIEVF